MKGFNLVRRLSNRWMFVVICLILPQIARAQWQAGLGAQSKSMGHQALAFLPNEIWIHTGDSVTWTSNADEIHTVSFLTAGQIRLPFQVGCPGFTATGFATFDGSTCISTPPLAKGQTFTVNFPTPGNFKLVCLVHQNMAGVIHVLDVAQPLPHEQHFYDVQASQEANALLSDNLHNHDTAMRPGKNSVTVGLGEVVANGGGFQTLSVMRFMEPTKVIHAGGIVEWTNLDPATPHTVTFGVEPPDPVAPVNATLDPDGAMHGTVNSSADNVHSGLILAAPQDQMFLATPLLSVTRFRVTFPHAGVFPYICMLHDGLGMKGEVIVLP
jgi:plastocyanin